MADERVTAYTGEATRAFLYGFDAAAIALCRATLEQVFKEIWVQAGLAFWEEIQKSRVELSVRIEEVSRLRPLTDKTLAAARRIAVTANTVLHQHLHDDKVRKRKAADCLSDLVTVVAEVYG